MNLLTKKEITQKPFGGGVVFKGVYFLIKDNEVAYVGQSQDIMKRISQHLSTKDFNNYYIQEIDEEIDYLDEIETAYIAKFVPKYNKFIKTDINKKIMDFTVPNQKLSIDVFVLNNKIYTNIIDLEKKLVSYE